MAPPSRSRESTRASCFSSRRTCTSVPTIRRVPTCEHWYMTSADEKSVSRRAMLEELLDGPNFAALTERSAQRQIVDERAGDHGHQPWHRCSSLRRGKHRTAPPLHRTRPALALEPRASVAARESADPGFEHGHTQRRCPFAHPALLCPTAIPPLRSPPARTTAPTTRITQRGGIVG